MKRILLCGLVSGIASVALADDAATAESVQTNLNVVWTLVAAILVFLMQAGFALVETGFPRAKNAANIMMTNLMDCAVGALAMYGLGAARELVRLGWSRNAFADGRRGILELDVSLLSDDVRRDGGDDRLGSGRRAH